MHIPDGFLSPQTCVACYAAAIPAWYASWRLLKNRYESSTAAHIAMAAGFVFALQMINLPIPGGTSGHAVGAAMVTLALGPAAAIISVSLALFAQAAIFGDGGLWAFGANVLTMAIVPALVTHTIARAARAATEANRFIGTTAFASGYLSAVAGALVTGLLLGIQPILFKTPDGLPDYFPMGFDVTIPAMAKSHLLVGIIEGLITLAAIRFLAAIPEFTRQQPVRDAFTKRLLTLALAVMFFIVPLGIILPAMFNAGDPWGEWNPQETAQIAGHPTIPPGLARYSENYTAPIPDYRFSETSSPAAESLQYILAGLVGMTFIAAACTPVYLLQRKRQEA